MGLLARKSEQVDLVGTHLTTSPNLVESFNDEGMYAATLNNLGLLHIETPESYAARRQFEAASEKCRRLGDFHHEASRYNNLADLFHALDMLQESLHQLMLALSLLAQIGQQEPECARKRGN